MGSLRKVVMVIFVGVVILVAAYIALRAFASWKQGYTWNEMDWDQDGRTSLSEFINSSDVGKRSVEQNGQSCIEYFAFKDGLPIKTVCGSAGNR